MSISTVSIIVPVYNRADFLRECMDSILCQTYEDTEIIVVDDGSTDESASICDEYAKQDRRVRIFHRKNEGVSAARNFGLKKATGKYIQFVDSDDILSPDATEYLVDQLESNAVQLSIGNVEHFSSIPGRETSLQTRFLIPGVKTTERYIFLPYDLRDGQYGHGFHEIACPYARIFLKEVIDRFQIRFTDGIFFGEDVLFVYIYLSKIEKVSCSNKVLYFYREHRTNSTARELFCVKDWARNFSSVYQMLAETAQTWPGADENDKASARNYLHTNHAIMIMFCLFVTRKHAAAKLWKDVRFIASDEFSRKSLAFYVPEPGNSTTVSRFLISQRPVLAYTAIWVHFLRTMLKRWFFGTG